MNVVGHGVDLVDITAFSKLIDLDDRIMRCFTQAERDHADNRTDRLQFLAGRFAAKEAIMKALGTGFSQGIAWDQIETRSAPSGQPEVVLLGASAALASALGVCTWLISISHSRTLAIASVIAVSAA